ncbi:hypothetical protein, partial [Pseudomonas sp. MPR-R2A5]|uniref:hypothetical protein n=1 Tax=Pseudomonas sp. MPR-R2A5 TaxID=2070622 RepID=UPI001C439E97
MDAPAITDDDSAACRERRDGDLLQAAVRRPNLFQLRLRFVHEERIGIDEISPQQALTNRLRANERSTAASARSD